MMLTTHVHLVPCLSVTGAVPPLLLYAFKVWTGTTLRFALLLSQSELSNRWFGQVHMPEWQVALI
jgi:hypothetical protein